MAFLIAILKNIINPQNVTYAGIASNSNPRGSKNTGGTERSRFDELTISKILEEMY